MTAAKVSARTAAKIKVRDIERGDAKRPAKLRGGFIASFSFWVSAARKQGLLRRTPYRIAALTAFVSGSCLSLREDSGEHCHPQGRRCQCTEKWSVPSHASSSPARR